MGWLLNACRLETQSARRNLLTASAFVGRYMRAFLKRLRSSLEPVASPPLVLDSRATHHLAASVWEESDDEEYRRDQSHWRGHGRWKDDQRWLRIGKRTLAGLRQIERLTGRAVVTRRPVVLEWGPGGGSNLFALRKLASKLYATDVSKRNLQESGRVLKEGRFTAFQPILLQGSLDEDLDIITDPIDIFISSAVFQHFPSKQYGLDVLAAVGKRLAPNGIGRIQLRFDNGNPRYRPKTTEQYKRSHITATSYALDEFWDALKTAGCQPLAITSINPRNNYATFLFAKSDSVEAAPSSSSQVAGQDAQLGG
jgi:hypothetical protein